MTYYRYLLAIASVAIFYTNVPDYVNMITNNKDSAPMFWVIGFCLLSLPLLIEQMMRSDILKSPLIIWCFGFAWLTAAWFFLSSQSDIAWQEVRWRVLTISQLLMFLVLFAHPDAARSARQAVVAGVLFGVALNIYELFVPLSFSRVLGRSAGLYLDPNITAEALVIGMILSATVLPAWCRGPFILLTGIGVFTTLSRGGMLAWAIAVMGFLLVGRVRLKDLLQSVSIGLLLVLVVLLPRWDQLLTTLERTGAINKNMEERLAWITDPSGVSDYSSWERKYLAKQAWEKIADHPFLGSGTGSAREEVVGAHNQYLSLMQDHGLLGAAIVPLLVLAVTWGARGESRGIAMVFGCIVMVLSFFTHTFMYRANSLMLLALMAAMVSISRESEIQRTQAITTRVVGVAKAWVRA